MPGKVTPIWIPAVLSVLTAVGYLGFMMAASGISNDIQAGHWDDGLFIVGMLLFLCAAFFIWPPWGLFAIAAIWAVYGVIVGIYRYLRSGTAQEDGGVRKRRRITGRTPEEEIWFDRR